MSKANILVLGGSGWDATASSLPNLRYVGHVYTTDHNAFNMSPKAVINISREVNRLFLQATGQGKAEVFAEGERNFFLKVVDAQVTFQEDGSMVLHQNGQNLPGKKIE